MKLEGNADDHEAQGHESPESRDTPRPPTTPASALGPRGTAAAQGQETLAWSARDGLLLHRPYAEAVQDELEDLESEVLVTSNVPVIWKTPDGSIQQGVIDTLIERGDTAIVLDYKTHDMQAWTVAEAHRQGLTHGQQVRNYVESVDLPKNTRGFIIVAGRPPGRAEARQAYLQAAAQQRVGVEFATDGDPQAVAQAARAVYERPDA